MKDQLFQLNFTLLILLNILWMAASPFRNMVIPISRIKVVGVCQNPFCSWGEKRRSDKIFNRGNF